MSANENVEEREAIRDHREVFKCDQCPKTCKLKDSLRRHVKYVHLKHEKERRHKCELCQKNFKTYQHLENHINAHLGLKPYKCEICSKRCVQRGVLETHKKLVHPTEPKRRNWVCSKCDKSYFTKHDLDGHFKNVHEGVRYSCPTCSASFKYKGYLKCHQLIHTGDLPFQCKQCPKKFREKRVLRHHVMRKHVGEKAHKCSYCQKMFYDRNDLKRHLVVHTKDSPHSCALCSKPCATRQVLENHMRTHTLEKPYKCVQCSKAFTAKRSLIQHQWRKHETGGNAFTCVFCNLKCGSKSQLKVHYLRHVQEKPYSCRRCDKSFCARSNLNKHFRTHTSLNARH